MFTETQTAKLRAPLDKAVVLKRSQGGRDVSYIEGWHAIAEANRIFGEGFWDRETEITRLGEPYEAKSSSGKMTWRVSFMAKVKITVRSNDNAPADRRQPNVVREGIGYGSGAQKDPGDAHESAIKEAETDAMKRALMTFGNPFGLALYDKQQRGVTDGKADAREIYAEIARFIKETSDPLTLNQGMKDYGWLGNEVAEGSAIDKIQKNGSAAGLKELIRTYSAKLKNMNQKDAA